MPKVLSNSKGNAIVAVLITVTMMSSGFLYYSTKRSQAVTQTINEMTQRYYVNVYNGFITSVLKNPESCAASFAGSPPTGVVTTLKLSNPTDLYSSGDTIGATRISAAQVKIDSMMWSTSFDQHGRDLVITYVGKIIDKSMYLQRTIRINYILSAGNVSSCAAADIGTLTQACDSLRGTLANGVCTSPRVEQTSHFNANFQAQSVNTTGNTQASTATLTNDLNSGAVSIAAAGAAVNLLTNQLTSTGDLNTGSLVLGSTICNGPGTCQNFSAQICPVNSYMYGVNSNGVILCAAW